MKLRNLIFAACLFGTPALAQQTCTDEARELHPEDANQRTTYCLDKMQSVIDNLQEQIEVTNNVFRGIIVAFNRSETEQVCPAGWTHFKAAGGRAIIGAGQHENDGVSEYPSFNDDEKDATGGLEQVKLTTNQMPSHDHGKALVLSTSVLYGMDNGYRYHNSGPGKAIASSGGGQAHENRPPYIALYFCEKD